MFIEHTFTRQRTDYVYNIKHVMTVFCYKFVKRVNCICVNNIVCLVLKRTRNLSFVL